MFGTGNREKKNEKRDTKEKMFSGEEEEEEVRVQALVALQPAVNQTLVSVLGTVAVEMRMSPSEVMAWVKAVQSKLEDIGVESVQDFVTDILVVNGRLKIGGHCQLHRTTLKMMWSEVCQIIFRPDEV